VTATLTPREYSLIVALRSRWRFGEVTIVMRDGTIQRVKRAEIFDNLDG
jgi:hypothetical protein